MLPAWKRTRAVIYRGPSQLTGDPIMAVVTGLAIKSDNPKTGGMAQVYILRSDIDPSQAVESGGDRAICGDCQLRGDGRYGRGCYVTWWQAPRAIYYAVKRDNPPTENPWLVRDRLHGKWIRIGAYGDPTAVPIVVWAELLSRAGGWVGYTQQWATCNPGYQFFLMASVHTAEQQAAATALKWRTYRTRLPGGAMLPGEAICPASKEADHKLTCQQCGICQGSGVTRANAAIVVHGHPGNLTAFGVESKGQPQFQHGGRPRKAGGLIPLRVVQSSPPPLPATGSFGIGSRPRKKLGRPFGSKNRLKGVTGSNTPGVNDLTAASVAQARVELQQPGMTVAPKVAYVPAPDQAPVHVVQPVTPWQPMDERLPSGITQTFLARIRYGPGGRTC